MRYRRILLLSVILCMVIAGCGGEDSEGAKTQVQLSISWGARSRVNGPGSALSVVIRLEDPGSGETGLSETVNRRDDPAAYTESYISEGEVEVGDWDYFTDFHAQPDGEGDLVATTGGRVTIKENGTGIPPVTAPSLINSVSLVPGQQVQVDETIDLLFTARDSQDNPVEVTQGSAFFEVVSGADRLTVTPSGTATGRAPGEATVRVEVDGRSAQGTVSVLPATS